jgi:hypothetical protein
MIEPEVGVFTPGHLISKSRPVHRTDRICLQAQVILRAVLLTRQDNCLMTVALNGAVNSSSSGA